LTPWNFKIIDAFSIYILKNENAHRWALLCEDFFLNCEETWWQGVWVVITVCGIKERSKYQILLAGQSKSPKDGILSSTTNGLAWDTRSSIYSGSEESHQT